MRRLTKISASPKEGANDFKRILRQKLLKLLRAQKEEDRFRKSKVIQKKLFSTPEFKRAKTILFYASFDGEVETLMMMKQAQRLGKRIALPKILKDQKRIIPFLIGDLEKELVKGPYGIEEPHGKSTRPLLLGEIDLVIIPGVGFDRTHNRLGRGAGYYDRFLCHFPSSIPTFGLAFDFQIVPRLPHRKGQDIPVSSVISN